MRAEKNFSELLYVRLSTKVKPNKMFNNLVFLIQALLVLTEVLKEKNLQHLEKSLNSKIKSLSSAKFLINQLQRFSPFFLLSEKTFTEFLAVSFGIFLILSFALFQTNFLLKKSWVPRSDFIQRCLIDIAVAFLQGFETWGLLLLCLWFKLFLAQQSWMEVRRVTTTNNVTVDQKLDVQGEGGFSTFDELIWHSLISQKIGFFSFKYLVLGVINFISFCVFFTIGLWEGSLATCLPLENISISRNFSLALPRIYKLSSLLVVWIGVYVWPEASPLLLYPLLILLSMMMLAYSWVTSGNYSKQNTKEIIYIVS